MSNGFARNDKYSGEISSSGTGMTIKGDRAYQPYSVHRPVPGKYKVKIRITVFDIKYGS